MSEEKKPEIRILKPGEQLPADADKIDRESMTNNPKRRWYQYSLRTLFIITTLVAVAGSWYTYEMRQAAKRRAAIAKIQKLGGYLSYYDANNPLTDHYPVRWYSWLRRLHGDKHLGNIVIFAWLARASPTHVSDADLVHLKGLTSLTSLDLSDTQITDAGMVNLKDLTNLIDLWLGSTKITDAGLVHLEGMGNLKSLYLSSTKVTDAGLVHLEGMGNLEVLYLSSTKVTDEGVKKLQEALPNCLIAHKRPPAI
ncbi:MAG: leucine-rich repeat domain-containing protein [Thermoguttaceae bacterium]